MKQAKNKPHKSNRCLYLNLPKCKSKSILKITDECPTQYSPPTHLFIPNTWKCSSFTIENPQKETKRKVLKTKQKTEPFLSMENQRSSLNQKSTIHFYLKEPRKVTNQSNQVHDDELTSRMKERKRFEKFQK